MKLPKYLSGWMACLAILLPLAGCAAPARAPNATATRPAAPVITLKPTAVSPNQQLTVDGAGFPPDAPVAVRIEPASGGRPPAQVARIQTNGIGAFKLLFTVPGTWPDGAPIAEREVMIVASAADGAQDARAPLLLSLSADQLAAAAALDTPEPTEAPTPTPAEVAIATATPLPAPTPLPAIAIEPASGGPGATVRVIGSGFPANAPVGVWLGIPEVGLVDQPYAEGASDGNGNVDLSFDVPIAWPDGREISEPALDVVLRTADGTAKALIQFAVGAASAVATATETVAASPTPQVTSETPVPALTATATDNLPTPTAAALDVPSPETPDPIQGTIDFLLAVIKDPLGTSSAGYLSQRLQAGVSAGQTVLGILNLGEVFNSFEVSVASVGDNNAIAVATLNTPSGPVQRTLNLIREDGNWRIDDVR